MSDKSYAYAGLKNVFDKGLSVVEAGERIRRFAYIEERLMFMQAAQMVHVPERDFKTLLGRLQWESGRHATMLRARMGELRLPKGLREAVPDEALEVLFDEAMHAKNSVEVVAGLQFLRSMLFEAYEDYLGQTNHLADFPSVHIIRQIVNARWADLVVLEVDDERTLVDVAYNDIVTPEQQEKADAWRDHLERYLDATGGMDGVEERTEPVARERARTPFKIAHELKRDETLSRVWDFSAPPQSEVGPHLAHMMAIRLSEINVAEGLAIVLCETPQMAWSFYEDISRHLWDEVRHSLMGEAAIQATLGDRAALPMRDYEGHYCMEASPLEQYATLGLEVEAANMKYPVGKRGEWEFVKDAAQHPLMTTFQDYDWADEVLHVNIARGQLGEWFEGGPKALMQFGKDGKANRARVKTRGEAVKMPDIPDIVARGQQTG